MGADARGRRQAARSAEAGRGAQRPAGGRGTPRGQKLVVQMVETFREHMEPPSSRSRRPGLAEQAELPPPTRSTATT
jgi:malonate decarboxylase alpha subunit